ncbi:MAG: exodeoxyribonuclease VII small subunit [Actinomycetota bacterium]
MTPDEANREVGYAAALEELETILRQLEGDSVDIDVLAERVQRAAFLIRLCRGRIQQARVEVEQIVADLEGEAGGGGQTRDIS